jgi:GNAT superfamily N-acetyltransferase
MEVRRLPVTDPLVAPLLAGLAAEYEQRYGPNDELASVDPAEFDPPDGAFLVLVDADDVIAGGGIHRLSGSLAEVKRMWTSPARRRQGHAGTVLRALEDAARDLGYRTIRLETGPRQPEAVALYESAGYRSIATFGRYPAALAFEREL